MIGHWPSIPSTDMEIMGFNRAALAKLNKKAKITYCPPSHQDSKIGYIY